VAVSADEVRGDEAAVGSFCGALDDELSEGDELGLRHGRSWPGEAGVGVMGDVRDELFLESVTARSWRRM